MPHVLVKFEQATLDALDRIVPRASRGRAEFIRKAVKDAIFRHEQERMRQAYTKLSDSAEPAPDWELPEDWEP